MRGGAPFPDNVITQTDRRYLSFAKLQPRFLHSLLGRPHRLIDQIMEP